MPSGSTHQTQGTVPLPQPHPHLCFRLAAGSTIAVVSTVFKPDTSMETINTFNQYLQTQEPVDQWTSEGFERAYGTLLYIETKSSLGERGWGDMSAHHSAPRSPPVVPWSWLSVHAASKCWCSRRSSHQAAVHQHSLAD
jgi:hypothetical protein